MPFNATVLSVLIASPGDVRDERQIVRDVVGEWNAIHSRDRETVLLAEGWESHSSPIMGDRPQGIINKQLLEHCDLLVAVFWTKLGSPTGEADSGTVEEIEKHLAAGKPAMIYFSAVPIRPDSVDNEQYTALTAFRDSCKQRGLYATFDTPGEFAEKFRRQLAQTIIRSFPGVGVSESAPAPPALKAEAKELLLEAVKDPTGTIMAIQVDDGLIIQSNQKQFGEPSNARSEARWKAAIAQLEQLGCIADRGHNGEIFSVTDRGFEAADRLAVAAGSST